MALYFQRLGEYKAILSQIIAAAKLVRHQTAIRKVQFTRINTFWHDLKCMW
jgi:hypothetical protein